MPIVQITLVEGRDEATISRCVKETALSIQKIFGAPLESVRVMVYQVPKPLYCVGDRTREEIDAQRLDRDIDDAD